MIQRIQTIWLLAAAIFIGILLFLPYGQFTAVEAVGSSNPSVTLEAGAFGLKEVVADGAKGEMVLSTTPLAVLLIIAVVLPLLTIFLFKNRKLQNRLCILEIVLLLVIQGLLFYYAMVKGVELIKMFPEATVESKQWLAMMLIPLVSILFTWLAKRGIMKDEKLVRSMDRLR